MSAPHASLLMIGGTSDPYFSSVVQLAHFDGTNGSQTFTNSCSQGTTFTAAGTNAALITLSTSRLLYGTASLRVGNTSGTGWANANTDTDYNFGTGDFTVEFAFWPDTVGTQNCIDMRAGGVNVNALVMYTYSNGRIAAYVNGVEIMVSAAGAVIAGQWNLIAYTRATTTGSLYVGGTRVATAADSTNYNASAAIDLPSAVNNSAAYSNCNYDEVRVTNGVARYTGASYTVQSAAFPDF